MSVRVRNNTDQEVSLYRIRIEYLTVENDEDSTNYSSTSTGGRIAPGEQGDLQLPTESFGKAVRPETMRLELAIPGLLFENGQSVVRVEDLGEEREVRIEADTTCPPLKEDEYNRIVRLVQQGLEGVAPIPMPLGRYDTPASVAAPFWQWVAVEVQRDPGRWADVRDNFINETCFTSRRGKPVPMVTEHPRRPRVDSAVGAAEVAAALREGGVCVRVHHRALDRYPGGNADVIVMCHQWRRGKMTAVQYRNWDGTGYYPDQRCELDDAKASAFEREVLPSLIALVEGDGSVRDHTCTVIDTQCDSDEYDTEWTSIEVSVCMDDGSAASGQNLVLRLHQHALFTGLYRGAESEDLAIPAGPRVAAVLAGIENSLGVGRVEQFSEGEGEAASTLKQGSEMMCFGCVDPVYLDAFL